MQGIPDFRSPGGMYDTLQPERITATSHQRTAMRRDATSVVERTMFEQNPFPYLEVRRPFILGTQKRRWKATIAHRFVELLHIKLRNKFKRLYTQNIDGLDYQCSSIPLDKIVPVHGTIGMASCESCGKSVSNYDNFCKMVETNIKDIYNSDDYHAPKESTPILCEFCDRPSVKPSTVLFGSSMPDEFFNCVEHDFNSASGKEVDLLIIAGTSLVVSPANHLVNMVSPSTVRVIVNRDPVGQEFGINYDVLSDENRDFFAQGDCDMVFLELIDNLGWMDELTSAMDDLPEFSARLIQRRLN